MSLSQHPHYKSFMDWIHEADVYMKWVVVDRFGNMFKRAGQYIYRRPWNGPRWRKWRPSNRYTMRRVAEPYKLRSIPLPFSLAKQITKAHSKDPIGRFEGKFNGAPISLAYVSGNWDIGYKGVYVSFPDIEKHNMRILEFGRVLEHLVGDNISFRFKENE